MFMSSKQKPVPHAADHGTSRVGRQAQQVANLLDAGKTYADIAKIIGKSVSRVGEIADSLRGKSRKRKPYQPRPKSGHRSSHNKTPDAVVEKIRQLLRESAMSHTEIAEEVGTGKSVVSRISAVMNGSTRLATSKAALRSLPANTGCNGTEHCTCTWCQAERLKTPEMRRRMHEADEAARLGACKREQPSKRQGD